MAALPMVDDVDGESEIVIYPGVQEKEGMGAYTLQ